jgi:hypothetical protein
MRNQILPRIPMPGFQSLTHLELYLSGSLDWAYQHKQRVR